MASAKLLSFFDQLGGSQALGLSFEEFESTVTTTESLHYCDADTIATGILFAIGEKDVPAITCSLEEIELAAARYLDEQDPQ